MTLLIDSAVKAAAILALAWIAALASSRAAADLRRLGGRHADPFSKAGCGTCRPPPPGLQCGHGRCRRSVQRPRDDADDLGDLPSGDPSASLRDGVARGAAHDGGSPPTGGHRGARLVVANLRSPID